MLSTNPDEFFGFIIKYKRKKIEEYRKFTGAISNSREGKDHT